MPTDTPTPKSKETPATPTATPTPKNEQAAPQLTKEPEEESFVAGLQVIEIEYQKKIEEA